MKTYQGPSFQDRLGRAAEARRKAVENLRAKPPEDEAVLAERREARAKREAADAEKRAAKLAAREAEKEAARQAAPVDAPAPSEAERKAARDARYAARKKRK